MRLKKIEVLGFKSFADRQVVIVDEHVTGVIGPNGCGKSNIVDAIRWCMGEQSAKHLRGSGMSDVIFAGCTTRGPGSLAEVTLTLTNDGQGAAGLEHPEIGITRRLFADGTSEYLINKVPARLRDITELLMGTGVGTKGYSIIEQGQVGRIVGSKPEDRRHIIDEAAGITRFKAQKAAASRKIEATRQNLLRVNDVIAELETRLGTLRRQAQKAERYKRYRKELRDLDLWMHSHRFLELMTTGAVLGQRQADLSQQSSDLRSALETRETQLTSKRTTIAEVEGELSTRQQSVFDLDNRVRLLEAEDDYRKRERHGLVQSSAQAQAEAEAGGRTLEQIDQELQQVVAQRKAMGDTDGPDGQRKKVETLEEQWTELEAQIETAQAQLSAARAEVSNQSTKLAGAQARRQSHHEALENLGPQIDELDTRLVELSAQMIDAQTQWDEAKQVAAQSGEAVVRQREQKTALDGRRSTLREQLAAAEVELDTKRAEVHRCRSRLQSLEEIQSRYRGCQSAVQVIMAQPEALESAQAELGGAAVAGPSPSAVHGILADYVRAPEHLETAVSAVLGDQLEGVVVDRPSVAAAGVELLKQKQEGRTAFLPRFPRAPALTTTAERQADDGKPLGWAAPQKPPVSGARPFEVVDLSSPEAEANAPAERQTDVASCSAPMSVNVAGSLEVGERVADEQWPVWGPFAPEFVGAPNAVSGDSGPAQGSAACGEPIQSAPGQTSRPQGPSSAQRSGSPEPSGLPAEAGASTGLGLRDEAGVVGRLADLVEVSGELGALANVILGDAWVVDGLSRALELWETHEPSVALVTLDGDRIEPTGVVVGGSPTTLNSALLQQKREIRELQEILESLGESFEAARGKHLGLAQELAETDAAKEALESEILAAEKAKVSASAEVDRCAGAHQRTTREHADLGTRRERVNADLARRREQMETLSETIRASEERIEALQADIARAEENLATFALDRDRIASDRTEAKVALARWQQQYDALTVANDRLTRQAQSERQRIDRLQQTATDAAKRVEELEALAEQSKVDRNDLVEQSKAAAAGVHDYRERFEALRVEVDELDESIRTLRGDLEERRGQLQEVELGLREIGLERDHLLSDASDRFDVVLTEVLVDFHDRPVAGKAEKERQKELKRILSRMGEVNLTAITEFEEVSERFEYLTGQRGDLEVAIDQLQEAIDRINKTTRTLFKETFVAVNERFQQLFPRLFNGGRAELKLTDPNDLLATGVEISAQPPGKQPRTLDLLSGGEKALTAVSLIFAIFLIKPSPFCILDEVDAPLDDANVSRFCGLVRELAGGTQFIIITHNKVTMETADRLYGVTMEQRGISKLVSVNLRRAVELAYN